MVQRLRPVSQFVRVSTVSSRTVRKVQPSRVDEVVVYLNFLHLEFLTATKTKASHVRKTFPPSAIHPSPNFFRSKKCCVRTEEAEATSKVENDEKANAT